MKRHSMQEDTPFTIAVALGLWGAGVAFASFAGVFTKLSPATFEALAVFAAAFAVASYFLDLRLRDFARRLQGRTLMEAVLAVDGLLLLAAVGLARADGAWRDSLAAFPFALAALYLAPIALVIHAAQIDRHRLSVRSREAKSPGATPAAT